MISEQNTIPFSLYAADYSHVYASNVFKPAKKISITLGARLSAFTVLGGGKFYTIDEQGNIKYTVRYAKGAEVKTYYNLELRLSVGY